MIYIHLACLLFISIIFLHSNGYIVAVARVAGWFGIVGLLVATSSLYFAVQLILLSSFVYIVCCCFSVFHLSSLLRRKYFFCLHRFRGSLASCGLVLITPYFTLQMNNRNEMCSDALWRYLLQIIFRRHENMETNHSPRLYAPVLRLIANECECVVRMRTTVRFWCMSVCVWRIIILQFLFFYFIHPHLLLHMS